MTESFDVFLSHNSKDKPAVRELAETLRARGLKVWLDEWELVPGRPWQEALEEVIETCRSSAVLVGKDGLGPWQNKEMRVCLSEFLDRDLPVIPVLLPGAPEKPTLPIFLKGFTWVDLRGGLTEEGIDRLQWGATGKRPHRSTLAPIPKAAPEAVLAAAEAQQASAEARPAPLEAEASATEAQEQSAQSFPLEPEVTPVSPKALPIAGASGTVPTSGENRSDLDAPADEVVRATEEVRAQVERVLAATDWGSRHEQNRDSDAPGTEVVWAELTLVPRALLVRSLLDLLNEAGWWRTEWQCLVLLRYAIKAAGGREHVPDVIAAVIPYLRDRVGSVQEAAFRLLKEAPMPLRLKWETFLRAWPGSSRTASSWLCRPLVEYCPFTERGRTGAAVVDALKNQLCDFGTAVSAFKELNYRQAAGLLRTMLVEDVPDPASAYGSDVIVYAASVLAEWNDKDAILFIKEAIDLAHPRHAYRVCELLHCLLKIDGETSIPYVIELVADLKPAVQLRFLERGPGVNRCRITNLLPTIARLLEAKDIHQDVRAAVNEILAGASSGST
ncbi:MAG TPA: toll/interleukin-1 receptor domain-containing protein [Thermoanaerobaculia bacterium]|nr:toll/interleukin-1 receptor domain-containing protein [Thermoanaerobaculia bacterium]